MKKCPFCAEEVKDEAIKCKHCGERLDGGPPATAAGRPAPPTPAVEAAAPERTLVEIPGAKVTTARAIFGPRTYATAHITMATSVPKDATGDWALAIVLTLTAAFTLVCGGVMVAEAIQFGRGSPPFALLFASVLLGAGAAFLVQRARTEGRKVAVIIESSSGRATALVTADRQQADEVVAALHEAMAKR